MVKEKKMRVSRAIKALQRRAEMLTMRLQSCPDHSYDKEERAAINRMIDIYFALKSENDLFRSLLKIENTFEESIDEQD